MECDVAILGGGAAGLAAAAAAAEAGARCIVFEATDRIGRPILASGNGRCNFSNARIEAAAYRNPAFVQKALAAFEATEAGALSDEGPAKGASPAKGTGLIAGFPEASSNADGKPENPRSAPSPLQAPNGVVSFFQDRGLLWREEAEGRLYPLANKASVVLGVLRACLDAGGVEVRCGARVSAVEPPRAPGKPFTLRLEGGELRRARTVIVACGGTAAAELLPDCFAYADPQPTLGPIATDTRWVRRLDNIRVRCAATLLREGCPVHREQGELLFRKYGISGIMTFNLSRLAQPGDTIELDFLPNVPADRLPAFLAVRKQMLAKTLGREPDPEDILRGAVLPPIAEVLLEAGGMRLLKSFPLEYRGIGDARNCQVHRGGFAVDAFDPATCEARSLPGLHVVGEALDVDGPCGGYNLHWAFATGILAARHAAAQARGA